MFYLVLIGAILAAAVVPLVGLERLTAWAYSRCNPYDL